MRKSHSTPMNILPFQTVSAGQVVKGFLHLASEALQTPCVILSHGLMSSMESPKFRLMAESFRQNGLNAARFDFRGCGSSEGDIGETTVSGRVADLHAVIECLRTDHGMRGPTGLLGSSMGGYVSLLILGERKDIQATAVWATPFDLQRMSSFKDHPDLASLGESFYEDLPRHDLTAADAAPDRLLVVHGECDEVIPQRHAFRIYRCARPPKALHILPAGNHRLTDPDLRRHATELSLKWFQTHLASSPGPSSR